MLRDTVPDPSRVAVLWNADNPAKALELAETESATPPRVLRLANEVVR